MLLEESLEAEVSETDVCITERLKSCTGWAET